MTALKDCLMLMLLLPMMVPISTPFFPTIICSMIHPYTTHSSVLSHIGPSSKIQSKNQEPQLVGLRSQRTPAVLPVSLMDQVRPTYFPNLTRSFSKMTTCTT